MTTNTDTAPVHVLATKGNGTAVHLATEQVAGYGYATLCDAWGNRGAYGSRILLVTADAPTCKTCIRKAAK